MNRQFSAFNVLVVEDQDKPRERLMALLETASDDIGFRLGFDAVKTYREAIKTLQSKKYDLILLDILLLPPEFDGVNDGYLTRAQDKTRVSFTVDLWNKYVQEEGGLAIHNHLRRGTGNYRFKTPSDVPIVVMSYFDGFPGFGRIIRPLKPYAETIIAPKFHHQPGRNDDETGAESVMELWRLLTSVFNGDLIETSSIAETIRQKNQEKRHAGLRRLMLTSSHLKATAMLMDSMTYSHSLEIEIDLTGAPDVDWDVVETVQPYPLSFFYESWGVFLGAVLLNPLVKKRFFLETKMHHGGERLRVPLLSINYDDPNDGSNGNMLLPALKRQIVLSYMAFHAEPPLFFASPEGGEPAKKGWAPDNGEYQDIFNSNTVKAYERQWGFEFKADPTDIIRNLRGCLKKDIADFNKVTGSEVPDNPELIIPLFKKEKGNASYFNGDFNISLHKDEEHTLDPNWGIASRIPVLVLRGNGSANFDCADEDSDHFETIVDNLKSHFPDAKLCRDEQELADEFGDGHVVLVLPADSGDIKSWMDAVSSNSNPKSEIVRRAQKFIMVPDDDANTFLNRDVCAELANRSIHVIYTKDDKMTSELKVFDTIICQTNRVKYNSKQSKSHMAQGWFANDSGNQVLEMRRAFAALEAADISFDETAGSISMRAKHDPDGLSFWITASHTDKLKMKDRDIALVERYSPTANVLTWYGIKGRDPSSCAPWHATVYHAFFTDSFPADCIIHTHAKALTYAKETQRYATDAYSLDGTVALGTELAGVFADPEKCCDFGTSRVAIINGHGEVVIGRDVNACVDGLIKFRDRHLQEQSA